MKKKGQRSKKTKRSRSKGREEECFKTKRGYARNGDGEKQIRKHEVEKKKERETLRWRNKARVDKERREKGEESTK